MSEPMRWLVYACRTDYTVDVIEIIARRGEAVAALVDNLHEPVEPAEPAMIRADALTADLMSLPAVIPLTTPGHRHHALGEAQGRGITRFPSLIDPTAIVASSALIGEGSVLNAAAVIAGDVQVGRFVHVNRSASIGHHSVLEDFSTLGPGCVLAGRVRVGTGAFIGAGAVCAPEVTIGPNAVVGAGAVVVKDVPAGAVVVGNPAQVIRQGDLGYGGVRVP